MPDQKNKQIKKPTQRNMITRSRSNNDTNTARPSAAAETSPLMPISNVPNKVNNSENIGLRTPTAIEKDEKKIKNAEVPDANNETSLAKDVNIGSSAPDADENMLENPAKDDDKNIASSAPVADENMLENPANDAVDKDIQVPVTANMVKLLDMIRASAPPDADENMLENPANDAVDKDIQVPATANMPTLLDMIRASAAPDADENMLENPANDVVDKDIQVPATANTATLLDMISASAPPDADKNILENPANDVVDKDIQVPATANMATLLDMIIASAPVYTDLDIFLNREAKRIKTDNSAEDDAQPSKSDTMVDAAVLAKLEEGFAKLAASDSKSLLKKYLTKEVFDSLKNKKTPTFGSTLLDCIQSGLENHDSGVGIYAPDAESYTVFADLFDPIIEDYHGGFKKTDKHPQSEFGDVSTFGNVDPTNEYVISTRVRCGRSMQGYPFNPCLTEAQYKEMEAKVSTTLSGLEGELKGKFYPLTGMEKTVQQQLIDDHFLFKEGDRFLQTANACRYWPAGRGIYHNDNKTFLVWCNEEDHLRIISMQMGGDLGEVYRRLVTAVNDIEKRIPFSHDDRLGFLTFCPTNLGTTIRASVHIKVPKLAANLAKLEEIAGKYNLQVRGTRGEHTEAEGGVYDISNKRRMGLTEYQAVKEMYDGITELIKIEKSL